MSVEPAIENQEGAPRHPGVEATFVVGESYMLAIRDHEIFVDQPFDDGGDDLAPTPDELFIASLAACVAYHAGRYLTRQRLSRTGLQVRAEFDMSAESHPRVTEVRLRISAPTLPVERRSALLAAAKDCTVHNTLDRPPRIDVDVD